MADFRIWKNWRGHFKLKVKGASFFAVQHKNATFTINFDSKWVLLNPHQKVNITKIASRGFKLDYFSIINIGNKLKNRYLDYFLIQLNSMISNTTFYIVQIMKNILFIVVVLMTFSCNKSPITNPKSVDKSKIIRKVESTQPQNNMQTNPITYELIKDMHIEDVIRQYPPILDEIFILGKEGGTITEFRIGLLNIFKVEEIENNNIKIREVTWDINSKQNLTVWYNEKDNNWIPIDHFIWDKGIEF